KKPLRPPTGCSVWCWKASTPIDNSPTTRCSGGARRHRRHCRRAGCSLSALPTGPVISPPPTPPIRLSELLADPTACLADAGLRLILSLAGPLWLLPTDSGCLATAELYLEWSSARDLPQRLDALAKAFADNQIVSSVFPAADIARLMSSTPAVHSIAAYCRRHDLVDLADPVDVRVLPFVLADAHANADDDQSTTSACFAARSTHSWACGLC
uniref:Photolyase/cryptochrome alpha/beta domain-containing protein n=1 Tax=Macrostomum lignano TaxID=282301 RepID=A0A1I8FTU0_9PLAT